MGSSRSWLVLVFVLAGCSVGVGEGTAVGTVSDPGCELDDSPYDLEPSFFGADVAPNDMLEIRVQRGGDLEGKSDGIVMLVRKVDEQVRMQLGQPIALGAVESPVMMSLYLNDTCRITRTTMPVAYVAQSGSITFESIYSDTSTADDVEIAGAFTDVYFTDDADPDERHALLSGSFRFLYNRGRPAQRFP